MPDNLQFKNLTKQKKKQTQQINTVIFEDVLSHNINTQLYKIKKQNKVEKPLVFINYSGFNPPTQNRRLCGDYFYLHVRFLQQTQYHICCNRLGFHTIQATSKQFNPKASSGSYFYLLDLLFTLSEKFKEIFNQNIANYNQSEFDKLVALKPNIFKYYARNWISQQQESKWDLNKMLSFMGSLYGLDPFSRFKQWNEMLQIQKNSNYFNILLPLNKHKFNFKILNEFSLSAVQAAKAVRNGALIAMNPHDQQYNKIYSFNGLFLSYAMENTMNFKSNIGSETTPTFSALNTDIRNYSQLMKHQIEGLNLLNYMLIDYKGHRLIVQSTIPGILYSEYTNCIKYGSIDEGKTIKVNKEFEQIMKKIAKIFNCQENVIVIDQNQNEVSVVGSVDIKGLQRSDNVKYIMDFLRLSPRDLNYPNLLNSSCILRKQLISSFLLSNPQVKLNCSIDTGIRLKPTQKLNQQENDLKRAAKYILQVAIPQLIEDMMSYTGRSKLSDSNSISELFHFRGVNMRYLGYVIKHQSSFVITRIIIEVVIVKGIKHYLRKIMRESPQQQLCKDIVHILNCIFDEYYNEQFDKNQPENQKKQKKTKKKKKQIPFETIKLEKVTAETLTDKLTGKIVFEQIQKIMQFRYGHIPKIISHFQFFFQKIAILRDVCISTGLVLCTYKPPFSIDSVVRIDPIIKFPNFQIDQIQNKIKQGQKYFNQYNLQKSLENFQIALQYCMIIYGGMHHLLAMVYQRIALVYYKIQQYNAAIFHQKIALHIYQMVQPYDSTDIILAYQKLGFFYYNSKKYDEAIYYTQKSLLMSNIIGGQNYPQIIILMMNLSTIYQSNKQIQVAIQCLFDLNDRITNVYGMDDYNSAICLQALAALHVQILDINKAILLQKKSIDILSKNKNQTRMEQAIALLNKYKGIITEKKQQKKKQKKKEKKIKEGGDGKVNEQKLQEQWMLNKLRMRIEQARNLRMGVMGMNIMQRKI